MVSVRGTASGTDVVFLWRWYTHLIRSCCRQTSPTVTSSFEAFVLPVFLSLKRQDTIPYTNGLQEPVATPEPHIHITAFYRLLIDLQYHGDSLSLRWTLFSRSIYPYQHTTLLRCKCSPAAQNRKHQECPIPISMVAAGFLSMRTRYL